MFAQMARSRREGEILIDGLDALGTGVERVMQLDLLGVDEDLAGGRCEGAREDVDKGRLSCTIVAHEPEDLAGIEGQIGTAQRRDTAEVLPDPPCLEHRCPIWVRQSPAHRAKPRGSLSTPAKCLGKPHVIASQTLPRPDRNRM